MMVKLFYTSVTCGAVFRANRPNYLKQKNVRKYDINQTCNNYMYQKEVSKNIIMFSIIFENN